MIDISITLSEAYTLHTFETCNLWVAGTLFIDNNPYEGLALATQIKNRIENHTLDTTTLNGFFAFCYESPDSIILGTDHLKTKSVFYAFAHNTIYISDIANNLASQLKLVKEDIDPYALQQFLATGYVFDNNTLFEAIKYVEGGTICYINKSTAKTEIREHFSFAHHREPIDIKSLKTRYDKVISNSFDRLIQYANGRQIVIPLSAGHDSLLTISTLKDKDYTNLLAFTYGRKNNREALISKQIASNLGVKWLFVEYTPTQWNAEWNNTQAKTFANYAMNYHCLPHIQDYIAVKEMKTQHLIDDNAIFVPGHCVTGVSFPKSIFYEKEQSEAKLVNFLFRYHFVNDISIANKHKDKFVNHLKAFCQKYHFTGSATSFADIVEIWQWKEREPKYIANSIRNYTFFGYDYWMPLWDIEHARFWMQMPFEIAGDRKWFEWCIQNKYNKLLGKEEIEFTPILNPQKEYILGNTKIRKVFRQYLSYKATKKHPLLFNAIYSDRGFFYEMMVKGNHFLNGYARKFLDMLF